MILTAFSLTRQDNLNDPKPIDHISPIGTIRPISPTNFPKNHSIRSRTTVPSSPLRKNNIELSNKKMSLRALLFSLFSDPKAEGNCIFS